jgi:hypothetical protein
MSDEIRGKIFLTVLVIVAMIPMVIGPILPGAILSAVLMFIVGFLICLITEEYSWKIWALWPLAIVSERYIEWGSK